MRGTRLIYSVVSFPTNSGVTVKNIRAACAKPIAERLVIDRFTPHFEFERF
jgi:hypothetical protein